MKFIITIIVFISIVCMTLGAQYRTNTPDPKNPDNCLVDSKSFTPGTHNNPSPTTCERVECSKGGGAVVSGCGVSQMQGKDGKDCINEGYIDVSLPYPECCAIKWSCS